MKRRRAGTLVPAILPAGNGNASPRRIDAPERAPLPALRGRRRATYLSIQTSSKRNPLYELLRMIVTFFTYGAQHVPWCAW
jgi:hypothetical protein